ncbi:MAG: hypothetical protein ACAI43_02285 [Phycisphaerae bacterium]|nr:hypothetical protein [Tepidisphaeraceae bacterium]
MFGNRLGWGLAAVLALGVFGLVALVASMNKTSPPSKGVVAGLGVGGKPLALNLETDASILDPIVLPFRPTDIVPQMTQAQDAAPLYREAIAAYKASRYDYDPALIIKNGRPRYTDLDKYPALIPLVKARHMTQMSLYKANPESVITYASEPPDLKALNDLGTLAYKLAFALKDDPAKRQTAVELAEAAFSLGVKMAEERLRYIEWFWGSGMLREAALVLGSLDESRKVAAADLSKAMGELLSKRTYPLWQVVGSVDGGIMGRTAGDVYFIAKNAKERLWRIEAVLKLGLYRYTVGGDPRNPGVPSAKGADQRQALPRVRRIKNDPNEDPAVRAAAAAAESFSRDDFQRYGS